MAVLQCIMLCILIYIWTSLGDEANIKTLLNYDAFYLKKDLIYENNEFIFCLNIELGFLVLQLHIWAIVKTTHWMLNL